MARRRMVRRRMARRRTASRQAEKRWQGGGEEAARRRRGDDEEAARRRLRRRQGRGEELARTCVCLRLGRLILTGSFLLDGRKDGQRRAGFAELTRPKSSERHGQKMSAE